MNLGPSPLKPIEEGVTKCNGACFTPWIGRVVCVGHAYISVTYVFLILVAYVLALYACCYSWLNVRQHVKVDGAFLGCVCCDCMSVMHINYYMFLCIH